MVENKGDICMQPLLLLGMKWRIAWRSFEMFLLRRIHATLTAEFWFQITAASISLKISRVDFVCSFTKKIAFLKHSICIQNAYRSEITKIYNHTIHKAY